MVENGLGAVDTPDENGYVDDEYRIEYLREHIIYKFYLLYKLCYIV
ncbi:hypothetical protein [Clostridium sp. YIM B02555]